MGWTDHRDHYQSVAREIDLSVRLTTKDAWYWRAIAWLLSVITFGSFPSAKFLERFATTLGPVQAYPRGWASLSEGIVVHESRHTRQARWCGLWTHPWVGLPIMGILYLLLPLPMGLAWFRYRFELDADAARWRHMLKSGTPPTLVKARAEDFAATVASSAYGWPWPKPWVMWGFKRKLRNVIVEYLRGEL